jgi:hypothetical protein
MMVGRGVQLTVAHVDLQHVIYVMIDLQIYVRISRIVCFVAKPCAAHVIKTGYLQAEVSMYALIVNLVTILPNRCFLHFLIPPLIYVF